MDNTVPVQRNENTRFRSMARKPLSARFCVTYFDHTFPAFVGAFAPNHPPGRSLGSPAETGAVNLFRGVAPVRPQNPLTSLPSLSKVFTIPEEANTSHWLTVIVLYGRLPQARRSSFRFLFQVSALN